MVLPFKTNRNGSGVTVSTNINNRIKQLPNFKMPSFVSTTPISKFIPNRILPRGMEYIKIVKTKDGNQYYSYKLVDKLTQTQSVSKL
jgi:hypothetical protein